MAIDLNLDFIGIYLTDKNLLIDGNVGNFLGANASGSEIQVNGDCEKEVANRAENCEFKLGTVYEIANRVGDFTTIWRRTRGRTKFDTAWEKVYPE